jgi:hypothetical protein
MKYLYIFFFSFLLIESLSAQKIQRAINSYKESKYQKALELFDEIIQKDNTDIAALIGKSKIYLLNSGLNLTTPSEADLKNIIYLLKNTRLNFNSLSFSDKVFISNNLEIFNYEDISALITNLSDKLWILYVSSSNSVEIIEEYKSKFANSVNQITNSNNLLSDLYFNKINNSSNILDFYDYIKQYPSSKHKNKALKIIENLEFNDISKLKDVKSFENYLVKYPYTEFRDSIHNELARFYYSNIINNKTQKDKLLIGLQQLININESILSKSYIDSCRFFLFEIDKQDVLDKSDLESLTDFIEIHKNKYANYIIDVVALRDLKWKELLEKDNDIDLFEVSKFIRITGIEYDSLHIILNYANEKLVSYFNKIVFQNLKTFISENSFFHSLENNNVFFDLIKSKLNYDLNISNKTLYDYLKSIKSPDEIYESFFLKSDFVDLINANTLYFKPFGDNADFLELIEANSNSPINHMYFELFEKSFYQINQPKNNFPIFNAIKQRYSIASFSSPNLKKRDIRGYTVLLYGYLNTDLPCCPSYQIEMLYSKTKNDFIPLTAIAIDKVYVNISSSQEFSSFNIALDNYQKIDKKFLLNLFYN